MQRSGLYSKADVESDKIIINHIVKSCVKDNFDKDILIYSEESGYARYSFQNNHIDKTQITSEEFFQKDCFKWVIDPLCGSIPYSRGIADFIVSIALLKTNEIILGVVYDPVQDELFYASKNKGAFLNNQKILPSHINSLSNAYISVEHKVFRVAPPHELKTFISTIQRLRVAGTCGLEMAYVACGRLDAVVKLNQPLYDYAAGLIIAKEAIGNEDFLIELPSFKKGKLFVDSNPLSFICNNALLSNELENGLHDWNYDIDLHK